MPDYSEFTPDELDEFVALGVLNLIGLLIDAGIERDRFQHHLDRINTAVAELTLRANRGAGDND